MENYNSDATYIPYLKNQGEVSEVAERTQAHRHKGDKSTQGPVFKLL